MCLLWINSLENIVVLAPCFSSKKKKTILRIERKKDLIEVSGIQNRP